MKIGIYNPYFDSLGGGERYCLTLASHWAGLHHGVAVFWDDKNILKNAENRFKIDLSRVKVVQNIFRGRNILKKALLSKNYDLIFFLSDGSIPLTFAKKNILHFQSPFPSAGGRNLWNTVKLQRFGAVVCNSGFTKRHIDREFNVDASVIYPPVAVNQFAASGKQNIILSVGRFHPYKKQKELAGLFQQLRKELIGWKLYLAGGLLEQDRQYFEEVKRCAAGSDIVLWPNASFERLRDLYGKATIYWHGAGYEQSEEKTPEALEHFGITTIEAMASGCIPIVYDAGGQREIVKDGENGLLWRTPKELIEKTKKVIDDKKLQESFRREATNRAKDFDEKRFCEAFDRLLESMRASG